MDDDSAGKLTRQRARRQCMVAPPVALMRAATALRRLTKSERGATIVDAGIAVRGGIEAGRRIAEICMGGLGVVTLGARRSR